VEPRVLRDYDFGWTILLKQSAKGWCLHWFRPGSQDRNPGFRIGGNVKNAKLGYFLVTGLFVVLQAASAHAVPVSLCNGEPNGIIDGSEECESGACCANCELLTSDFVCRPAVDAVCDIAEYCDAPSKATASGARGVEIPAVPVECPADVLAPNGTACDDASVCTLTDVCQAGVCTGEAILCSDDNACTDDYCDTETGCLFQNNTASCDDELFCTVEDVCSGGSCGGSERNCGDENSCTTDTCDDETDECVSTNNTDECSDGNACTSDDVCADGTCAGVVTVFCNDDDPCTDDVCDTDSGNCSNPNNTAPCDDGSACSTGDTCDSGKCIGVAVSCDDKNPCTTDSCNEKGGGCDHANNSSECDDGDICTTGDICEGGNCTGTLDEKNPACIPTTTTTLPECQVCGDYEEDCDIDSTDAFFVLQGAVGLKDCPLVICDYNGSGIVTALDALAVLRQAVEIPSDPMCPVPDTTTTLPDTTTTTIPDVTTTTIVDVTTTTLIEM